MSTGTPTQEAKRLGPLRCTVPAPEREPSQTHSPARVHRKTTCPLHGEESGSVVMVRPETQIPAPWLLVFCAPFMACPIRGLIKQRVHASNRWPDMINVAFRRMHIPERLRVLCGVSLAALHRCLMLVDLAKALCQSPRHPPPHSRSSSIPMSRSRISLIINVL